MNMKKFSRVQDNFIDYGLRLKSKQLPKVFTADEHNIMNTFACFHIHSQGALSVMQNRA